MKKTVKNYKSFVNETVEQNPNVNQPGAERKISKENKYKFQLPFDKKVVDKLNDYNFNLYTPEGEKESEKKFIVIDIMNLTYSVVSIESPDIRTIEASKLKYILENL